MYSFYQFNKQSKISFDKHWNPHASQFYSMVLKDTRIHWGYRDLTVTRLSINNHDCEICSGKKRWINHLNNKRWLGFEWGICQVKHIQKLMDKMPQLESFEKDNKSFTQPMDTKVKPDVSKDKPDVSKDKPDVSKDNPFVSNIIGTDEPKSFLRPDNVIYQAVQNKILFE